MLESDNLQDRLKETSAHLNPRFGVLFDEMLKSRVDRLATEPEDPETLVEAVTLYHMVIEGMLALTGQHFIISSTTRRSGRCPASSRASTTSRATSTATSPSARGSCAKMAEKDQRYRDAIPAHAGRVRAGPADGVLQPPCGGRIAKAPRCSASDLEETRAFAMKALEPRLKVIGLAPLSAS